MAHTYMVFEFPNEEKAQQARHKLEGWKQAFRLDKKLQVKFDRGDEAATETTDAAEATGAEHESAEDHKKGAKAKAPAKSAKATKFKKSDKSDEETTDSGPVKLLVRLYFSGHEKITEKQWLDRIPADELFKVANPYVVNEKDAGFDDTLKQFDTLE
jgi:hypothetical protein